MTCSHWSLKKHHRFLPQSIKKVDVSLAFRGVQRFRVQWRSGQLETLISHVGPEKQWVKNSAP
ncbi:hypothetical protein AUR64_04205 [Haloprofundus marisrubri]|uniref:Uncharacterized protein n=1 Tax=Haloprofundus marisrubri TaxID=1514971 RepID=A0A0W1RDF7_9EURY|nr:hypothetical protein AUR64_04205 [Haloprofundus marisrubri]